MEPNARNSVHVPMAAARNKMSLAPKRDPLAFGAESLQLAGSQAKLNAPARQLNKRPGKALEYETPAQRFGACIAAVS